LNLGWQARDVKAGPAFGLPCTQESDRNCFWQVLNLGWQARDVKAGPGSKIFPFRGNRQKVPTCDGLKVKTVVLFMTIALFLDIASYLQS